MNLAEVGRIKIVELLSKQSESLSDNIDKYVLNQLDLVDDFINGIIVKSFEHYREDIETYILKEEDNSDNGVEKLNAIASNLRTALVISIGALLYENVEDNFTNKFFEVIKNIPDDSLDAESYIETALNKSSDKKEIDTLLTVHAVITLAVNVVAAFFMNLRFIYSRRPLEEKVKVSMSTVDKILDRLSDAKFAEMTNKLFFITVTIASFFDGLFNKQAAPATLVRGIWEEQEGLNMEGDDFIPTYITRYVRKYFECHGERLTTREQSIAYALGICALRIYDKLELTKVMCDKILSIVKIKEL